ncbi:hypothetical protein GP486_008450 [Trichoglossum hirsutum]|uniref:Uncharacterized protein n=1 Tax=Trichoglossum hirsutum TaxID=265104 RepID=A0A9P8L5Y0_9PEZI|nr:hypothetical protein GP486_008450 [Trichoglossum hirsutum]
METFPPRGSVTNAPNHNCQTSDVADVDKAGSDDGAGEDKNDESGQLGGSGVEIGEKEDRTNEEEAEGNVDDDALGPADSFLGVDQDGDGTMAGVAL